MSCGVFRPLIALMASATESVVVVLDRQLVGGDVAELLAAALAALAASVLPSRSAICSARRSEALRPAASVSRTASVSAAARSVTAVNRSEVCLAGLLDGVDGVVHRVGPEADRGVDGAGDAAGDLLDRRGDQGGGATEGLLGEDDGQPLDGGLVGVDELLGQPADLGLSRPVGEDLEVGGAVEQLVLELQVAQQCPSNGAACSKVALRTPQPAERRGDDVGEPPRGEGASTISMEAGGGVVGVLVSSRRTASSGLRDPGARDLLLGLGEQGECAKLVDLAGVGHALTMPSEPAC